MRKAWVLLTCLFIVSGCAEQIRENVDRLFGKAGAGAPLISEPRYCYRTIGKVNCYSEPLKGQEANRLVGYDGKAPRSTSGTGPLRP